MYHFNYLFGEFSTAAILALGADRTHLHLCTTRYSFTPGSGEAFEGEVPCPRTQHRHNVPILRAEKDDVSLKILHQAGFETARQAATLVKLHALTIAPRPSLDVCKMQHLRLLKSSWTSLRRCRICGGMCECRWFECILLLFCNGVRKRKNLNFNLKMTLFDPEMTLWGWHFCWSPYQKRYVTVIINYLNVSYYWSAARSEKNNKSCS